MKRILLVLIVLAVALSLEAQSEPKIRQGERFNYVTFECTGSLSRVAAKLGDLMQELAKQKIEADGAPIGIFHNFPGQVPEVELRWEVAASISSDPQVSPPLKKKVFAFAWQAEMVHKGPYSSTGRAYPVLFAFIARNGYKPCGPVFETWMDPPEDVRAEDCRTLIVIPVEKK